MNGKHPTDDAHRGSKESGVGRRRFLRNAAATTGAVAIAGTVATKLAPPAFADTTMDQWAQPPTGVAETDGPMLRQLLLDAPAGSRVRLHQGIYAIAGGWGPAKNLTIEGAGIHPVISPRSTNAGAIAECPDASPWLEGTVILQTQSGTNGIDINASGKATVLRNFGIMFDSSIRYLNTGHGVSSVPNVNYNGKPDFGWCFGGMDNITVLGHDGNHYGFYLVNPSQLSFMRDMTSFGGGGLHMESNSSWFNCGNLTIEGLKVSLRAGGTAHGIHQKTGPLTNGVGTLNILRYISPQVLIGGVPSWFPAGVAQPTAAQYLFQDEGDCQFIGVYSPDFETGGVNSPCHWGGGTKKIITGDGLLGTAPESKRYTMFSGVDGQPRINSDSHVTGYKYPLPTVGGISYAGTGANAGCAGDDYRGIITLNTGPVPPVPPMGAQVVGLTWGTPASTSGESVTGMLLTPMNAQTPADAFPAAWDTGMRIQVRSALPGSSSLQWSYQVIRV